MRQDIVLSGVRTIGQLHVGHDSGALQFFAQLTQEPNRLCFTVNLQSLAMHRDPEVRGDRDTTGMFARGGCGGCGARAIIAPRAGLTEELFDVRVF